MAHYWEGHQIILLETTLGEWVLKIYSSRRAEDREREGNKKNEKMQENQHEEGGKKNMIENL